MKKTLQPNWIEIKPPLRSAATRKVFISHAHAIYRAQRGDREVNSIDALRRAFIDRVSSSRYVDRYVLLSIGLVIADLALQGWQLRVRKKAVEIRPTIQEDGNDRIAEKARIRHQELIKRDAQLIKPSVQKFLMAMERNRIFDDRFVSIFSLMRDGRELANELRMAREQANGAISDVLSRIIDPYLQFVTSEKKLCPFTGLRLMDIWRYFRHTWSNQYTSIPGRSMLFLVRDRAAVNHPIIGIGGISSPIMQIHERDIWIGWHPDAFIAHVKSNPTGSLARWMVKVVDNAIDEIYIEDFLEDGVLTIQDLSIKNNTAIEKLMAESLKQRELHYRFVRRFDHKSASLDSANQNRWQARARTHLFRSKRALSLATFLQARSILNDAFGQRPTAAKLSALASTGRGCDIIRKILKKAKADRIGIAVADISVCGAVQPYNAILGGKVVAMLAVGPEVVLEYRRRYGKAESEIASAIAGRPIIRKPNLVLFGTTSLYGVGSSQYNRIKIPCEILGGAQNEFIQYKELGYSKAFGTSQYSEETVRALTDLVQQSEDGQRVNSIFGEGVSPKLRKLRQGLDLLGLPSGLFLRHHRHRIIYAVSLIQNLREILTGLNSKPKYLIPINNGPVSSARIAEWWRERWLQKRIFSDDVLAEVERHTLVRPIRHGARVVIPKPLSQ